MPADLPAPPPRSTARPPRRFILAMAGGVLALVLLVLEAPFFLSAGLVAPLWAIILLDAIWLALLSVSIVMIVRRKPWWAWGAPVVAALAWALIISIGELALGWQA